jgi:cyanate lyase
MNRDDVTQQIIAAKTNKGLKWKDLADLLGTSKDWGTAALLGQMTLTKSQADAIGECSTSTRKPGRTCNSRRTKVPCRPLSRPTR